MRKLLMANGATFHPKFTLFLLRYCGHTDGGRKLEEDMLKMWDKYIDEQIKLTV